MNWDKNKDYPMFIKTMTAVSVLLRVPMLNEDEMEIYYKYLSTKFDNIKQFVKAADALIEHSGKTFDSRKEFPRVSTFLDFKEYEVDEREAKLIAQDAWNLALDTSIIYGEKVNPVFEDKLIVETINKMGGWRDFTRKTGYSTTNEDLKRRNKAEDKFVQTYVDLLLTGSMLRDNLIGVGDRVIEVKSDYKLIKPQIKEDYYVSDKTREKLKMVTNVKKIN